MIENANKVLVRASYSHVPPRCRKSRYGCIHLYRDTKEEALSAAYSEACKILNSSKKVVFGKKMTFQPAKSEGGCQEFMAIAIAGRDGCTEEIFDIDNYWKECMDEEV
jgi:hypothetical protein